MASHMCQRGETSDLTESHPGVMCSNLQSEALWSFHQAPLFGFSVGKEQMLGRECGQELRLVQNEKPFFKVPLMHVFCSQSLFLWC